MSPTPRPYEWAAKAPTVDLPDGGEDVTLKRMLSNVIRHASDNAPRSQQTALGPSELGDPCDRKIGYKLADVPKANTDSDPLAAIAGTALGAWMEQTFAEHPSVPSGATVVHNGTVMEWLVEQRLQVAQWADGSPLQGAGDLFHVPTRTVLDWKFMGKSTFDKLRREGPTERYRIQVQAYGLGYLQRGLIPRRVGIVAIPRSNCRLDAIHVWTEPFDPAVVATAVTRIEAIRSLVTDAGLSALPLLERTNGPCAWCPWWKPGSTDELTGCPGADDASYPYAASPHRHEDDNPAALIA